VNGDPVGFGGFREFMLDINIDGLKDDSSWRRLGALLHEVAVTDQQLATIRARLMERLTMEKAFPMTHSTSPDCSSRPSLLQDE
jgi:hypothetical protein